ncbi:MAG: hypothetical protein EOO59_16240 [Hymenobacter sp.]|nr:MAG: hypothetical protein EOO59_16240 [Hymenobacter sp.]
MALGDVDGDGDLDLLATGYSDNLVSVRLNGGDATGTASGVFSNGSDVRVGNNPIAVALGDLDGDGDLDLVTANSLGTSASVRLNGGAGTFGGGSTLATTANPRNVVLGDVDGDGDLDVVLCGSNVVSVQPNQSAQPLATIAGQASPGLSFTVAPTVAEAAIAPRYAYAGPLASATLLVFNAQGQQVRALPLREATGPLPTEGLAAGWYFARLVAAGQHQVARFYLP